jgi:hypothetical protein
MRYVRRVIDVIHVNDVDSSCFGAASARVGRA